VVDPFGLDHLAATLGLRPGARTNGDPFGLVVRCGRLVEGRRRRRLLVGAPCGRPGERIGGAPGILRGTDEFSPGGESKG
jgi:hypothetical protein